MRGQIPFSVILALLESQGWVLSRVYHPYRIFTKPGRLPIWIPVRERKVEAVYVKRIQRILEADAEEDE